MNALTQIMPPTPDAVPAKATPTGDKDIPREATVRMSIGSCMIWTPRMLQALERGNDGSPNDYFAEKGLTSLFNVTHPTA